MTIVQAHRRQKKYVHTFPDVVLKFEPNARGHIVCNVADQSAVDRLLKIPSGFCIYPHDQEDEAPASLMSSVPSTVATAASAIASAASLIAPIYPAAAIVATAASAIAAVAGDGDIVLDDGNSKVNLSAMTDDQLREFAMSHGLSIHHAAKGDTIRKKIVEFFTKGE